MAEPGATIASDDAETSAITTTLTQLRRMTDPPGSAGARRYHRDNDAPSRQGAASPPPRAHSRVEALAHGLVRLAVRRWEPSAARVGLGAFNTCRRLPSP